MLPVAPLVNKEGIDSSPTLDSSINHTKYFAFGVHDSLQIYAHLRELRRLKLWPLEMHQISIENVLKALNKFEKREIGPSMGFRMHGRVHDCFACVYDPHTKIEGLIKEIHASARGLCLECLRNSRSNSAAALECGGNHG